MGSNVHEMSSLRSLSLEANMIHDNAAECLADVIQKGSNISCLNLSLNMIASKGFKSLILASRSKHSKLKELNLSSNMLPATCIIRIFDDFVVDRTSSLQTVSVVDNA